MSVVDDGGFESRNSFHCFFWDSFICSVSLLLT